MRILIVYFLIAYYTDTVRSQTECGEGDLGKFCISFNFGSEFSLQFYDVPNKQSKPIAQLDIFNKEISPGSFIAGVSRITNYKNRQISNSALFYELTHGDRFGIAGLAYSLDSQWARISLDYRKDDILASVWINLTDARTAGIRSFSWESFFGKSSYLYFRCDSTMKFYSYPSLDSLITPELKKYEGEKYYDYSMAAIQTKNDWMQIYLHSPSNFQAELSSEDSVTTSSNPPQKMWIKYLDKRGRPQVWFMWD